MPKFRGELHYSEDQIWMPDALSPGIRMKQVRNLTINYKFSRETNKSSRSLMKNIYTILSQAVPKLRINIYRVQA